MKKVYLNVGLSEKDSESLKSMVKTGISSSKTDFIRTALKKYLKNLNKSEIGRGVLQHDKEGRIIGYNKRYFIISLEDYGFILKNLQEEIGYEKTKELLFNAGNPAGIDASTKRQRETGTTGLDAMKKHAEMALTNGWGVAELDINKDDKKINLIMKHCWEAEAYREIFKEKTKDPICSFLRGYIKGAADTGIGVNSKIIETKCIAKGDPHCEFEITF